MQRRQKGSGCVDDEAVLGDAAFLDHPFDFAAGGNASAGQQLGDALRLAPAIAGGGMSGVRIGGWRRPLSTRATWRIGFDGVVTRTVGPATFLAWAVRSGGAATFLAWAVGTGGASPLLPHAIRAKTIAAGPFGRGALAALALCPGTIGPGAFAPFAFATGGTRLGRGIARTSATGRTCAGIASAPVGTLAAWTLRTAIVALVEARLRIATLGIAFGATTCAAIRKSARAWT
jgi:hypothetical protein